MRPSILYPLFADLTSLRGIGSNYREKFHKLGCHKVLDLLHHIPRQLLVRRYVSSLRAATLGENIIVEITPQQYFPPHSKGKPYRINAIDNSGWRITLLFFHGDRKYIEHSLPLNTPRLVSGKLETDAAGYTVIIHPDYMLSPTEAEKIPLVEAIYPLTTGLSQKILQKAIEFAFSKTPALPEWLPNALLQQHGWASWRESLVKCHHPSTPTDIAGDALHRRRLAFDELLAGQIALQLRKNYTRNQAGHSMIANIHSQEKLLQNLPFSLTKSQQQALAEIHADMAKPLQMVRLLQGDVGSGKTIVAFLSALAAIDAGYQVVIMAPTEILARQHWHSMQSWAEIVNMNIAVLTGRDKGKKREGILTALQEGSVQLIVGTHALFQEDVHFKNLGLAIIDEQHRFGVHQRLQLSGKGNAVDLLVMTATPIPRTLLLTSYGDMETSKLTDKPAGRLPIHTSVMPLDKIEAVLAAMQRALAAGEKVYWVCPLVEESENLDLSDVTARFNTLEKYFPQKVGLIHGQMPAAAKEAALYDFINDTIDILVATTVIEVGVNVPSATIMIIEHAERFGLAQLHQLRGRVGRGIKQGKCLLLYGNTISKNGAARLAIMRETQDGFRLAEEDLRLRGFGEILGTKQSGLPDFKIANLEDDYDLLTLASQYAKLILHNNPHLTGKEGEDIRLLLHLFECERSFSYLRSG